MMSVILKLVLDEQKDQEATSDPGSKPEDVDGG